MTRQIAILATPDIRRRVAAAVMEAPDGYVVEIREPTRTLEQNAMLHRLLTRLSEQVEWNGKYLSVLIWKRLCTAAWLREIGEQPMLIPALDGNGFDVIWERTSRLNVEQCSSLIEWVLSFGAQEGVSFD